MHSKDRKQPSAQIVLIPPVDNTPAHTTRVWTALRVRVLTTLHMRLRPDALRLPNSPIAKLPKRSPLRAVI